MQRFETHTVHAGREDFVRLRVHAPPIDLSTTYPVTDLEVGTASFDALVAGDAHASNPIYARLYNPTVARTENAIATLEGTEACVAYGSGMAALTTYCWWPVRAATMCWRCDRCMAPPITCSIPVCSAFVPSLCGPMRSPRAFARRPP